MVRKTEERKIEEDRQVQREQQEAEQRRERRLVAMCQRWIDNLQLAGD